MKWIKAIFVIILLAIIAAGFYPFARVAYSLRASDQVKKTVVPTRVVVMVSGDNVWNAVQNWRETNGYPLYLKDQMACRVAQKRLVEIPFDWSHDGFPKYYDEEFAKNHQLVKMGENLSKNYDDSYEMVNWWAKSPKHLENLEADFTGGCVECSNGHCVHIFTKYSQ